MLRRSVGEDQIIQTYCNGTPACEINNAIGLIPDPASTGVLAITPPELTGGVRDKLPWKQFERDTYGEFQCHIFGRVRGQQAPVRLVLRPLSPASVSRAT